MKLIHVTDTSGRKVAIVAGNIGAVMPATCKLGGKDTPITAIMMVRFEDGSVWDVTESYDDVIAQLEGDETDEMRKRDRAAKDATELAFSLVAARDRALSDLADAKADAEAAKAQRNKEHVHTHRARVEADALAELLQKARDECSMQAGYSLSPQDYTEMDVALAKHAEGKK